MLARASVWDWFANRASAQESNGNSSDIRTIALLSGTHNPNPQLAQGGGDIAIVDGSALVADSNPISDDGTPWNSGSADQISLYVVRPGDTLSGIADMFQVTANTIRWANNLSAKASVHPGDKLIILPITGVKHVVKKGDTIASLAKQYKADAAEIASFNGVEESSALAVGTELIIPGGEVAAPAPAKGTTKKPSSGGSNPYRGGSGPAYAGYYIRPIKGAIRTQGIHGYNGVDLAAAYGAAIYAAAAGEVIISKNDGGWNGGYGNYIVIRHNNGTQTLYAHLSKNYVSVGQTVGQGDTIGAEGATGKATGPHLHFEIRGAVNPF